MKNTDFVKKYGKDEVFVRHNTGSQFHYRTLVTRHNQNQQYCYMKIIWNNYEKLKIITNLIDIFCSSYCHLHYRSAVNWYCFVTPVHYRSAVRRAKSDQCKKEIVDVVCKHESKYMFPESLPRFCPLKGIFKFAINYN